MITVSKPRHARRTACLVGVAAALAAAGSLHAAPVLMISIDGLRPADVLEAPSRGLRLPVLTGLVRDGAYATGVRNVLPTVTYPDHTTLITGVWPARHGVANNTVFDPLRRGMGEWYWYAEDIRVPTLWDAVHDAGRPVASLGWPVSVGARGIDANIPEYWRAHDADDMKLERALVTPGLEASLRGDGGVALADTGDTRPESDVIKARDAAAIYRLRRPAFFTLHLSSLDQVQHLTGPGSAASHAALEQIDAEVGEVIAAGRAVEPDLVVAIVSDHGFAPVEHDLNLATAFVNAGLITLDPQGRPIAWEAAPWPSGGSAGVVLARRNDEALRGRVAALLAALAADPASGVGRVIDRDQIKALGGAPDMDFFVDAEIGYNFGAKLTGPLVTPGSEKGTHGYFPDHPEMRATLILEGPGVPRHGALGDVDMRDIAPTLAKVLGVGLPTAEGASLF
jgi:predicted AlkP superfamily pyrophosphatase or phosphodiesterase